MSKKINLAIVLALLTSWNLMAQSVEEIIEKHFDAIGGKAKWESVKDIKLNAHMDVQGQKIDMVTFVKIKDENIRTRVEVNIMGNKMITVMDGDNSWMVQPAMMGGSGKKEPMNEEARKASEDQTLPGMELINFFEKGHKIEVESIEDLDGVEVYKMLVQKEGEKTPIIIYVETESHLIKRIHSTQEMGAQTAEVDMNFSDYKNYEGLILAGSYTIPGPMGSMNILVDSIELNKGVEDTVFTDQ